MDTLSLLLLVLIVAAFFIILKQLMTKKGSYKSTAVKKEEIIQAYERQMQHIILTYKDSKEELQLQKTNFLKSVSKELHKNIFFDESEVKCIIQHLASM